MKQKSNITRPVAQNVLPETLTVRNIAKLAGTSASTVSRVLSQDARISAATRDRVLAIVEQHHYKPNPFARALAGGRAGLIGVIASNIDSGFFADVLRGIDLTTKSTATHLICSFAHGNQDYFDLCSHLFSGAQVQGLILIDPPIELFDQPLPASRIPTILCASRCISTNSPWRFLDSVTTDNEDAMTRIMDHLADQGCRRITHLAGPRNTYDSQSRRNAFTAVTSKRRGLKTRILDGHLIPEDGRRAAETMLKFPSRIPEAVVAFNDSTAGGVLDVLTERGGPPGGRFVAITGWDNSPASQYLGFTSVAMPTVHMGAEAARLLVQRMNAKTSTAGEPQHLQLPATVHFRASTMLPKKNRAKVKT